MGEFCYCPKCQENRYLGRDLETDQLAVFIVLILLGYVSISGSFGVFAFGYTPAIIYLVYLFTRKKRCPVCKTTVDKLEPPRIKFEE